MKKSCGIFTNIAPFYSKPLWYALSSSKKVDYFFYSSARGFSGIKTIDTNESKYANKGGNLNWLFLKNILIGNIIIYQTKIISYCLKTNNDVYILYGEMNSFSNWIAALICKARKKPLIFWGHGMYGNEKFIKKKLRLLYYRIADYHLIYNNRSGRLLVQSGISPEKIFTVYNSLDFKSHMKLYQRKDQQELKKLKMTLFSEKEIMPVVIFIGRLTREKKISILLQALKISLTKGHKYNCVIVGDGTELEMLKELSDKLNISELIYFYGSSYDEYINSQLIMSAECCVSPGNIGLTAIHSLSLGTPVITHSNMFHQGPEAEAVIHGVTGLLFKENDAESLSEAIDDMILNRKKIYMEAACIAEITKNWNPVSQATIFDEAVLKSLEHHEE
jgi:glycosyltransferase involved in cell wall biosynthesis